MKCQSRDGNTECGEAPLSLCMSNATPMNKTLELNRLIWALCFRLCSSSKRQKKQKLVFCFSFLLSNFVWLSINMAWGAFLPACQQHPHHFYSITRQRLMYCIHIVSRHFRPSLLPFETMRDWQWRKHTNTPAFLHTLHGGRKCNLFLFFFHSHATLKTSAKRLKRCLVQELRET